MSQDSDDFVPEQAPEENKPKRGRPKGAKNKPKRGRPKKNRNTKLGRPRKEKPPKLPREPKIKPHVPSDEEIERKEQEVLDANLDQEVFTEAGYNTSTDKIINQEPIDPSYYYRGSKHIPVAGAQYEFTADMVEELRKCKEDITYFAENFFYIVSLDRGKEKIRLYEAQRRVLRSFVEHRSVSVCSSRQIGKCLNDNTLHKVRDKNTGEIKELTIKELFELGEEQE
jgi:hypothetical protein